MIQRFLDKHPAFDDSNFIASTASVIGDVTLGPETSIWFNATLRGDVNWIRIGRASNVQDNAVVHVTRGTAPTEIGDWVTIGHGAIVHGCRIRDRVLVGMGAVVMDHADVGEDVLIGARALVTAGMQIPPRSLVLGAPARVVRSLTDEEVATVRGYAEGYVGYSAVYRGAVDVEENPYYVPGAPRQLPGEGR